jgi:hypothetical protein
MYDMKYLSDAMNVLYLLFVGLDPNRIAGHPNIAQIYHHFIDLIPTIPHLLVSSAATARLPSTISSSIWAVGVSDWDATEAARKALFIVMEFLPLSLQVRYD